MIFYFTQDGARIEYSHEKAHVSVWETSGLCDVWNAPFKVRDFDTEAATRALALFQKDLRETFGQSCQFRRVDYDGSEHVVS